MKRFIWLVFFAGFVFSGPIVTPAFLFAADTVETELKEDGLADEEFSEEDAFFNEELAPSADEAVSVADPLRPLNYTIHLFNDKLYFWLLKPVASGYKAVVPSEIRVCARNFFDNLYAPIRFTNCLLQGKINHAAAEFGSFFINTTVGGLGLGDVAERYPELNPPEEDFGQTLGYWGFGNGFYLVLPMLGPSTLRDGIGRVGDWAVDPLTYLNPDALALGASAYKSVNAVSFRLGDYETIKNGALDPYAAFRDGYIQYRRAKVAK